MFVITYKQRYFGGNFKLCQQAMEDNSKDKNETISIKIHLNRYLKIVLEMKTLRRAFPHNKDRMIKVRNGSFQGLKCRTVKR